ncbi:MAG TPA: DNA-directed RNA polymerase subunit D [Candidatus Nanoarchaeia archaeon]|nr:DNA-directed RNA polymerase subunit D [Candidatus Nanoarchaeia archaeon]
METKILAQSENKLQISLEGIDYVMANTLRRLMIAEVPTMAIAEVEFHKNGSALYDEFLAHRIGLVPLKTDLKSYNLKDECKCKGEGCALCQVDFTLEAAGPCTVYSGDLKCKDPEVKPVYDNMVLVKLEKNQKLKLDAVAVLGKGKTHMKFSPGWFYYQHYPEIKIGAVKNPESVASVCPTKVFEVDSGKLKVKHLEKCVLCNACMDNDDNVEVRGKKDKFIFTMESFGQLEIKEIFLKALEIFDKKLNEFEKELKKSK